MSAESAKKKRIGSRCRGPNQNKISDGDEFHRTDSTSAAQHYIAEEITGSLNVLVNPDNLQSETQTPPLSEVTENRRKLGFSRKNEGGHHVKDSETKSHQTSREDVEEKTMGNETPKSTRMSMAMHPQKQEGLSQRSEHDTVTATHDSSLYSVFTPDNYFEFQLSTTANSENLHQSTHQNKELKESTHLVNLPFQENSRDAMLEETERFQIGQTEKVSDQSKESAHVNDTDFNINGNSNIERVGTAVGQVFEIEGGVEDDIKLSADQAFSENLIEQAEVSDTQQSELVVKSAGHAGAKHEDSNPDGKQGELPTEENSFEALKETNEDHHVYDTEIPQSSNIERAGTAVGQVFEIEGGIEDDIKLSADQAVCLEKEGFGSETKEKDSSSQILQSDIHFMLDSQPQPNNAGLDLIGSRRKMGSSRRKRGQKQVEESATESHHAHKNEDEESTKGEKALETTQILMSIESATHEESRHNSGHDVVMPETPDTSLYSTILPGYSSEIQNPTTTNYPQADLESFVPKNEKFQEDHHARDTDFKEGVTKKPAGATLEGMDEFDSFQSQEVRGAHHSENAVNKVHDQELHPAHEIDPSSESVTHDSRENSQIFSENLIEQAEVSDTQQSELVVKSAGHAGAKHEDSNPDGKQGELPTEENSFEALKETNEDHHIYDTEIPQSSNIERAGTAVGQVFEIEGGIEDDIKLSADQAVCLEKEGFGSETKEKDSSSQIVQSDIHFMLDSQPQPNNAGLDLIGSRRKMGSSRRKRGQKQVEESATESHHAHKNEDEESTKGEKALETTQILMSIESATHEESRHNSGHDVVMPETPDTSLYSTILPGYSSEIQNPTTTNYPQADLESFVPKNEKFQEDHHARDTDFKEGVTKKPAGATLEGMDEFDSFQSQEVRGAHHSENAVNKVHDQELHPAHEIDPSSESVTHDSRENSQIFSENLIEQAEVSDTQQSELVVKSAGHAGAKHEDSNPDGKQGELPTEENSFEALKETNEDHHVYDTEIPQSSNIERAGTAVGQVFEIEGGIEDDIKLSADQAVCLEKEGFGSETKEKDSSSQILQSDIHFMLDSQPQPNNAGLDLIGSRRKMGSSRRKRGQKQVEESATESHHAHKNEDEESTKGEKALETTQILMSIESATHEESRHNSGHDVVMPETPDTSLYSTILPGYSSEIQNPTTTNYPQADVESFVPKNEKFQEDHHARDTDFKEGVTKKPAGATLEGMDEFDSFQSQEVRGAHHSENAVNKVHDQELHPAHEIDPSSESVTHDSRENSQIFSENLTEQAEVSDTQQSELVVKSAGHAGAKHEDSNPDGKQGELPTEENSFEALKETNEDHHVYDTEIPQSSNIERAGTAVGQVFEIEGGIEDDIKLSADQAVCLEKEGFGSETKEKDSSSQILQSDIHFMLDSQPQPNNAGLDLIGSRRKMGSSRRKRGQKQVEESATESHHAHKNEDEESTKGEKALETTQILMSIESATHEESRHNSGHDVVMPETPDTSLYSTILPGYSSEIQNPTTTNYPQADLESFVPKNEKFQEDHHARDTDFKEGVTKKPAGATLEGMDEFDSFQSQEVRGAHHSENAVNKVHDQELHPAHEIDPSSESVTHDSRENSQIFSENLTEQAEVSDTQQSELVVKSAGHAGAKHEDSNPDGKQGELPTEENSFEALKETNEDHHVYDTEIPQSSNIERAGTAVGQVLEIEGGIEDDIKLSADQAVCLEKEGFGSETKEKDSSSQILQSDIHFMLDSQPQPNNAGLDLIGSRRKMGSSRRKRGQKQVEESATESHHAHKNEDEESTKGEKALETTQILMSIESATHEESRHNSGHDVVMPETPDTSLYSTILPGYSSEIQNPTTTNYPQADLESFVPKNEKFQEDHHARDTDFKEGVTKKPAGATLEGMDEFDSFQSQEVRGAHHSENAVNKVHDQELHPAHEIDPSSESVTHDSRENSQIFSENLTEQAEVSDTQQSELVVKSAGHAGAKHEDSNPDGKQGELPTEENSFEALKETNEDHHVYDTEIPQSSNIERAGTAVGQVFEIEGGIEDDIKLSADQAVCLEKEGFGLETKEKDSSSQILQSDIHFMLDSQPQPNNAGLDLIGSRRKMGSSRRKRGQKQVEESATESHHAHKNEDEESTKGEKALETTQILMSIESATHEESRHNSGHDVVMPETPDTSLYSTILPGYSSEIQNPTTTNYPQADLESFVPKNEKFQEDHHARDTDFKEGVTKKPAGATLEGMDEFDSFQSQEVRGAHHSENAVNKVHDQELHPAHEIDPSSESVTHDSRENSQIFSENLIEQAEVSDTQQSELVVKSADHAGAKHEDSNPDGKQGELPTEENSFEALKETNEDHHVYDTEIPQSSNIERAGTAVGQVLEIEGGIEDDIKLSADQAVCLEKEGFGSETKEKDSSSQILQSDIHFMLDSQPQPNNAGLDLIGSRRKMGSSRRKRGQKQVEESATESHHAHKNEDEESTKGEKALETTQILMSIESATHEESRHNSGHDVVMPETPDTSLYSTILPGYSSEIQNPTTTNYPQADVESFVPKNEKFQEDHHARDTDFKEGVTKKPAGATLEGMDEFDSFQSQEVRGAHHSENAVNKVHDQELHPAHEIDPSSESVTHDSRENSQIFSENLTEQAEVSDTQQSELVVKSAGHAGAKHEDSNPDGKQGELPTEENSFEALKETNEDHHVYDTEIPQSSNIERAGTAVGQVFEIEGGIEDDIKLSADQAVCLEKEGFGSETKEKDSSSQILQSDIHFMLDSQPQPNNAGLDLIGSRRKMGSSRRKRGQKQVEESATESHHAHKNEDEESTKGEKALETTQILMSIESATHEESRHNSGHDVVMPETPDTSLYSTILPGYSSEIQNPTTTNYPQADLESFVPKNEKFQEDHHARDTDFKEGVTKKPAGATLEGMDEFDSFQSQEVRGAHHSENAVNKVHDQELHPAHEIDPSSESVTHDSRENSQIFSENLTEQAEVSDTQQSELVVKSAGHAGAKHEDSNPDGKQGELPTEENSFEALKETNEDHHVYDTEIPQSSNIERAGTAVGQVLEIEGGIEDDIKLSADQAVCLEKEGFGSETKEKDSSSQILQSDIHFMLDSQPQPNNAGLDLIGSRRKMGSSRRKRGQKQVEESATESHHAHKNEDEESTKGEKALETTQILMSIESATHEESRHNSGHDVVMPETPDTSLYSTILPGYSSEIQNPTTTNYPQADLESFVPKNEKFQEDHHARDTDFKEGVTKKPAGATLEGMDEFDSFQSQEVRGAHHSENAVNKVHDQELHPAHEIDPSSESVTHDSRENSQIFSENLTEQAEVSDTQQSELVVKSAGHAGAKHEDSNPDGKQGELPTEENSFEALKETNEDHHVYDTEIPQSSNIERAGTAVGQVFEIEGGIEDDIKLSADQAVCLEKEGFGLETKEKDSSSQILQSDIHFMLDSQPQPNNAGLDLIGSRRKMGSSRRKRGQKQVEESATESHHAHKNEDEESTKGEKALETTQILMSIESATHEESRHNSGHDVVMPETPDTSLYSTILPGYSSEIQNPTTTNYPQADLESFVPKNEKFQEDHHARDTDFKEGVTKKPAGATLEGMDEFDSFQSQEVRGAHHSENAVNKVHDQELHPAHEIDPSSESVTHDSRENSQIFSENLIEQAEVSDTQQSELVVKSADHAGAKHEDSNPDGKQGELPTEENSFEALKETNEDHHVYDTEIPQSSNIERAGTAVGQVLEIEGGIEDDIKLSADQAVCLEKEGFGSETKEKDSSSQILQSDIHFMLDSQPQPNNAGLDLIGSRRKMGSSRRKRGQKQVEESATESHHAHKNEDEESTKGEKALETTQILMSIESATHEESRHNSGHDVVMPETPDTSLYSTILPGYSSEIQNPTTTNYPQADVESFVPKNEKFQEDHHARDTDFKEGVTKKPAGATLEGMDEFDSFQSQEVRGAHHSENAVNKVHDQELHPAHEIDPSSESVTHDSRENSQIFSENLTEQAEVSDTQQSELVVKSAGHAGAKHEDSNPDGKQGELPTEENSFEALKETNEDHHVYDTEIPQSSNIERAGTAVGQVFEIEGGIEDDIKLSADQAVCLEKEGFGSETKEKDSSSQILQSDIHFMLDSQPQPNNAGLDLIGSRRKMGSSRRRRGQKQVEDSAAESHQKPMEDFFESNRINEATVMSFTVESAEQYLLETTLDKMDVLDTAQTEEKASDQVKENALFGTRIGLSEHTSSSLHSKLTFDQSDATDLPEDELFNAYSVTEKKRQDEDEEGGQTDTECKVEQAVFSSPKDKFLKDGQQRENTLSEIRGSFPSVDVVNEVHEKMVKPTQMQKRHQTDFSLVKGVEYSLETLESERSSTLDSQLKDKVRVDEQTHTGFNPVANRRKLGSSRRNKGQQHVKDSTTTTLIAMEITRHEELKRHPDLGLTVQSPEDNSSIQNISYHDDNVTNRSVTLDQNQKIRPPSTDNVSLGQEINRLNEVGQHFEKPSEKDPVETVNASQEITYANLFPAKQNKTDPSGLFGLEENCKAESAMDVESRILTVMGACNSQQGIQQKTHLDNSEKFQEESKQKRRKMGSTRRTQQNKKPEEGIGNENETKESDLSITADMENFDKMKATEELPMIVTKGVLLDNNAKMSLDHVNSEQLETSNIDHKGQSVSHKQDVLDPVKSVHLAHIGDGKRNVDVNMETSQLDDFTCKEMHIGSGLNEGNVTKNVITGRSFVSLCETIQRAQNDEERPEKENIIQDQVSAIEPIVFVADLETEKSVVRGGAGEQHKDVQASTQEPNYMSEGAHNKNLEMKNTSPNLNSDKRRRKMGSTRKNFKSQGKREDLHQKQEVDNEATETTTHVEDVKTESFPAVKDKEELQRHIEDKENDSKQREEFETVEYSLSGESHFKPPSHHSTEEIPVSDDQPVETEYQLTANVPGVPSTSPKHDVMLETASGRRRKLGSHRKSHGPQRNETQTAKGDRMTDRQNKTNVKSVIDECATRTTEKETVDLDKISELDERDNNPVSSISASKAGEHSSTESEKIPVCVTPDRHPYDDISLGQQSPKAISLVGSPTEATVRSKSYNVMMIGDSNVGKTSFMKRAQSGKFSLDLPASVGLDSCLWTVVVDGKPVVLQLWDTAGQERFHSITRQIFHKAQAFLLMYDITSPKSFSAVSYWANCIQEGAAENVTILLIGNKSDHAKRQVKTQEGEILAKEYNFEFMECSAATGENVIQSLENVARLLSQKGDTREETMVLHKEPKQKKSSGCC